MMPVEGTDLFLEEGPHGLVWIEPIWKRNSAVVGARSAYAAVSNLREFLAEQGELQVTWIPLGFHRLVAG